LQLCERKKTDPKVGFFKVINYLAAAGADAAASAAAGADAAAASVAAGAEAAAAAGAATSAAGAGAASSFLLHATKAIANKDTNKSDFFI